MYSLDELEVPFIEETFPEEYLFKIYPYIIRGARDAQVFIKPNSASLVGINQDQVVYDEYSSTGIELDENNHKYFKSALVSSSNTLLESTSHTSINGINLVDEVTLGGVTNWYFENQNKLIKGGEFDFLTAVFTIGKPFDYDEYSSGKQPVFMASPLQEAKQGNKVDEFVIDTLGYYEINFINSNAVEKLYQKATLNFIEEDLSNISELKLKIQNHSLINRIEAKGTVTSSSSDDSGIYDDDIELKVDGQKFLAMKATPISTQEKLTMYFDWFDYDVVMPEFIAKHFNHDDGGTIETLATLEVLDENGTKVPFFKDSEIKLIQDAMLLSYAYSTHFADYPRYSDAEAQSHAGIQAGQLKGNLKITSQELNLVGLESQDPIKALDGLFEKYIRNNPGTEDRIQYRAVKQVVAALSRYLYTSYAIGKGNNSFNEIILPWFLRPIDGIDNVLETDTYKLKPDIKYKLYSRYFDLASGSFTPKSDVPISDVQMIQTDRKITLPQVSDVIQPLTKLPLPGDIDTSTEFSLMYQWYMPYVDNVEFAKLFQNDLITKTDLNNTPVTYTTPWKIETTTTHEVHTPEYVKQKYLEQHPTHTVDVTHLGTLESRFTLMKTITRQDNSSTGIAYKYYWTGAGPQYVGVYRSGDGIFDELAPFITNYGLNKTVNFIHGSYSISVTRIELNKEVFIIVTPYGQSTPGIGTDAAKFQEWFKARIIEGAKIDPSLVKLEVLGGYIDRGRYAWIPGTIRISQLEERTKDSTLTVTGKGISIKMDDRKTLYNKPGWKQFIKNLLQMPHEYSDFITLKPEYDVIVEKVYELIISQIWGDFIKLLLPSGKELKIPLFHKDDETIGTQRILFI